MNFKVVQKQIPRLKSVIILCITILLISNCSLYKDYHVEYTGTIEGSFEGRSYYFPCVQTTWGVAHSLTLEKKTGTFVQIYFPVNVGEGTYPLGKSDVPLSSVYSMYGTINADYDFSSENLIRGVLEITYFSKTKVEGNFQAEYKIASNEESRNLHITGTFKAYSEGRSADCIAA